MRSVTLDKNVYVYGTGDEYEVNVEVDEDDIIYWLECQDDMKSIEFLQDQLRQYNETDDNEPTIYLDDVLKNELFESVRDKFTLEELEKRLR